MWRNAENADFVVEESSHGKPVEGLIATATDAAVIHVRRDSNSQPFFTAPVERARTNTYT